MIAIYLSKQQPLDADPKAIQQINFTANIDRDGNTKMFCITEETKETILGFSQRTVKILRISSHDLARLAKFSNRKVSHRPACSTILLCFNIISI